ncbi:MAG: hypothetical protein LBM75_05305 [Myxococcales bacterium]|jgi:uncharacterized membrane protein YvlD (DUF360 family)|nr:hypothetical protein [Myxococcales bacterium]
MEKIDANYDFSMDSVGQPSLPPSNPLAIVALVLAIMALPLSFVPIGGLLLAIAALVLSIVAHGKSRTRHGAGAGLAVGGITLSILALLLGLMTTSCTLLVVKKAHSDLSGTGMNLKDLFQQARLSAMDGPAAERLREEIRGQVLDPSAPIMFEMNEAELTERIDTAKHTELLLMKTLLQKMNAVPLDQISPQERAQLTELFRGQLPGLATPQALGAADEKSSRTSAAPPAVEQ